MKRAQGIAKRYQELKTIPNNRLKNLEAILKYEYKKYLDLCYWCYESPLSYTDFLKQEITPKT